MSQGTLGGVQRERNSVETWRKPMQLNFALRTGHPNARKER